jgi:hypothetical protein
VDLWDLVEFALTGLGLGLGGKKSKQLRGSQKDPRYQKKALHLREAEKKGGELLLVIRKESPWRGEGPQLVGNLFGIDSFSLVDLVHGDCSGRGKNGLSNSDRIVGLLD